jgi:glyoxylase-like metal-dependent hydrolase (beta-lactamase superfamily II)
MDLVELVPRLHLLRFPVGHAYLWQDPDGLTLIDCGVPGSAPAIADGIRAVGRSPTEVRHLVLTHFHEDHVGSAAEIVTWGDVTVYAHRADAPFIRGLEPGPEANLLDWEKPYWDAAQANMTRVKPEPVRVDRELDHGDTLDFAGGALALSVPGHTPGSVAIYLPERRVLFTGDTVANSEEHGVILGVFNVDTELAVASLRRQAALDTEIACFGHGEPLVGNAGASLRAAAAKYPA